MCRKHALSFSTAALCLAIFSATACGATWYVRSGAAGDGSAGSPLGSIQSAISAAGSDDAILVAEGTYRENLVVDAKPLLILGGYDAAFASRDAASFASIIDGGAAASCVRFLGAAGEFSGFVVTNGSAQGTAPANLGGGIYCYQSPVAIEHNTISGNRARSGGGVCCSSSAPTLSDNLIADNDADVQGAGVYCASDCSPLVARNRISGNRCAGNGGGVAISGGEPKLFNNVVADNQGDDGGGLYAVSSLLTLTNNTFSGNTATGEGGAIYCYRCDARVSSCIFWGDTASSGAELAIVSMSSLALRFCDVAGGLAMVHAPAGNTLSWGPGMLDADPLFAEAAQGDYHVQSASGHWSSAAGAWVPDAATSPCIDAGEPTLNYAAEPTPNGGRLNMGAYGNTAEASKIRTLFCDLNGDCAVTFEDVLLARKRFLAGPSSEGFLQADVNADGRVNVLDLIIVRNRIGGRCE